MCVFFFFKQKTAYEMRISDWSSDVCSSDLLGEGEGGLDECGQDRLQFAGRLFLRLPQLRQALGTHLVHAPPEHLGDQVLLAAEVVVDRGDVDVGAAGHLAQGSAAEAVLGEQPLGGAEAAVLGRELGVGHRLPGRRLKRLFDRSPGPAPRSEEQTSELQSLMRTSYAVFCLKKKKKQNTFQAQDYM